MKYIGGQIERILYAWDTECEEWGEAGTGSRTRSWKASWASLRNLIFQDQWEGVEGIWKQRETQSTSKARHVVTSREVAHESWTQKPISNDVPHPTINGVSVITHYSQLLQLASSSSWNYDMDRDYTVRSAFQNQCCDLSHGKSKVIGNVLGQVLEK